MQRLWMMLVVLCMAVCLFACATSGEDAQPSTTTVPTESSNTGLTGSSSTVLIPEDMETSGPPILPTGTLPQITLPSNPPPDFTVPIEPTTAPPEQELS